MDNSSDNVAAPSRHRVRLAVGLVGAGIVAGAIGATAIGASAQSSGENTATTVAAATDAPGGQSGPGRPQVGHDGSAPVRDDEMSVSASTAATLKAAALKAVPGGTVIRIETDAGDAAYEAHMTKSDGTRVTVKFDKNLKVTKVESGMGEGDPAPGGHPGHR